MDERPWYVYLLQCKSNRVYTGATPDLEKRFNKHASGRGALFTRINSPQRILAAKLFPSKSAALSVEAKIKTLSQSQKLYVADKWLEENARHNVLKKSSSF